MTTTAAPTLADTLARIQRLPVMSAVAMEVLQSLNGADLDVDALARRIAQDQAIAARVLRVANSPFYGMAGRVASIHDAIMVLGLSAVRSLVLAAAVVTALPAGFHLIAETPSCPIAAMANEDKGFYGVQFHPESVLTPLGCRMMENWLGVPTGSGV